MKNIVYIILAITVIGCQKKQTEIPVNSNLMKAYGFNLGTYWIYYDSVSNETDSFVVSQAYLQRSPDGDKTVDNWYCDIVAYNAGASKYVFYYYLTDSEAILSPEIFYNDTEQFSQFKFIYPPRLSNLFWYTDSELVTSVSDNYVFQGNTFDNVFIINCYRNYSPDPYHIINNDWIYLKDNVGFIKIVINSPTDSVYKNWNLLRYHVQF